MCVRSFAYRHHIHAFDTGGDEEEAEEEEAEEDDSDSDYGASKKKGKGSKKAAAAAGRRRPARAAAGGGRGARSNRGTPGKVCVGFVCMWWCMCSCVGACVHAVGSCPHLTALGRLLSAVVPLSLTPPTCCS